MSSMAALNSTLTKQLGRFLNLSAAKNSRALVTSATRPPQGNMGEDAIKTGSEGTLSGDSTNKPAEEARGMASASAAETEEIEEEITDEVKQMAQDAWGTAKDTVEKVKGNILNKAENAKEMFVSKAEDTKESVKENANAVKNAMNTKNRR